MATLNEQGEPPIEEEPSRIPPRPLPGRALWRAFLIVSVFVFASSLLMMVVGVGSEPWFEWWTGLLVIPGFFLGVVVAAVDYVRGRRTER